MRDKRDPHGFCAELNYVKGVIRENDTPNGSPFLTWLYGLALRLSLRVEEGEQ